MNKIIDFFLSPLRNNKNTVSARSFSEIGKKDNQEDYVFPHLLDQEIQSDFFVLCDGMGGHDHGEIASKTVAEAMGCYYTEHPCEKDEDLKSYFEAALNNAYDELDKVDDNLSRKKMGTTLTTIIFDEKRYLAAHMGDSRIYQIRISRYTEENPTQAILFKTEDDSLVNQLLKIGEITEEEAKNFPQKNVITKAMQPNQEKRYKANIRVSEDLEKGDYFFMCCDGILEQLNDEKLCNILATNQSLADKSDAIREVCLDNTRDNFTCWLIQYQ